jgi:leucyl aminopeptidase
MIRVKAERTSLMHLRADAVALIVFQDPPLFKRTQLELDELLGAAAAPLHRGVFSGKFKESLVLYPASLKARFLVLLGAGNAREFSLERLRRISAVAGKTVTGLKARSLGILEPLEKPGALPSFQAEEAAMAMTEGVLLGEYRYERYITVRKEEVVPLEQLTIATSAAGRLRALQTGIRTGTIVSQATILARDLGNAPGNELYPESLARRVRALGRQQGLRVSVLDERRIRSLGMGGLAAVGAGSHRPPRLIIMEYKGGTGKETVVLVGKGVTFDSGGISIKPSAGMAEMKMDMAGAAAVIGTLSAVAHLALPVRLVGVIPATENMPGGSALRPGDILTHLNGKTSEVDNTDAEGRLILADALAYASRFSPQIVIDLATLTGACVVALGHHASGLFSADEELVKDLREAGERSFERVWPLPMFEEYEASIKSTVADVKNTGGRWGGAITAALFLKRFVGEYRWVHLDIAGTAMTDEAGDYVPAGASGVGVRLLVEFLRRRSL